MIVKALSEISSFENSIGSTKNRRNKPKQKMNPIINYSYNYRVLKSSKKNDNHFFFHNSQIHKSEIYLYVLKVQSL